MMEKKMGGLQISLRLNIKDNYHHNNHHHHHKNHGRTDAVEDGGPSEFLIVKLS